MIRYKDLYIPAPCFIDYNSLPYDEAKRFCGNCQKQVYDFRGKNQEFLNTIANEQVKFCGIFYEDQLNSLNNKKRQLHKSIYNKGFLKIISLLFFIKSFLTTHDSTATVNFPPNVSQQVTDSTGIKTVYKRPTRSRHQITIYINNVLYKKSVYPKNGFLYLPDTIKPDDQIKIKIFSNKVIKSKTYHFNYSEAETIIIKITGKRPLRLFRRKHVMGCPSNFW